MSGQARSTGGRGSPKQKKPRKNGHQPQLMVRGVLTWLVLLSSGTTDALVQQQRGMDLRPTVLSDLGTIIELEKSSYPSDEAASEEALRYRQAEAGGYFRTMEMEGSVIGFICGTRCVEFTEESMAKHEKTGRILAVHSVVVKSEERRRGLARRALKWYVDEMLKDSSIEEVALIAKAELLGLYASAGFGVRKKSSIVHGRDPWFECVSNGLEMVQVDAFSNQPFSGNPAAVVFCQGTEKWMQKVAAENNLAETAFLERISPSTYSIRWFTPATEVDLCGHATLAAAEALYATHRVDSHNEITFRTQKSGDLAVRKLVDDGGWLEMDMPTATLTPTEAPASLIQAVGGTVLNCVRGPPAVPDWLLEVPSLPDLKLDPAAFALPFVDRGVIVTSRGRQPYDFESRFFAPNVGIPEDPVTGSSFTLLTPFWEAALSSTSPDPDPDDDDDSGGAAHFTTKKPRHLLAYQASKRGGVLRVHTTPHGRTIVQGQATLVIQARLAGLAAKSDIIASW